MIKDKTIAYAKGKAMGLVSDAAGDVQQRMEELYDQMPERERQEVVDELVKSFRESPSDDQPQMRRVLQSDALGWPDDLKARVLAALP